MKKNNVITILFSIFAIIGVLLLIAGIIWLASSLGSGLELGGYIFLLIGAIFFLIGLIPLLVIARGKKKKNYLLANGRVLHAVVNEITWNTNIYVNGQNPYIIYCSYTDEDKNVIYRFKSGNLWTDPGLVFEPGSNIDVYVDANDYSNYYVNAEQVIAQRVVDYT